ncbi:hypothetical protein EDD11_005552 [Mortierella claussenii]|nr:hypothetical protein EDD11_005552 [Mortierella claussenii]
MMQHSQYHPQQQQQLLLHTQQRPLKSSKSVDGLRRARSHTADPTIHNIRRTFEDIYVNSPSLTQTQLDTYGSNALGIGIMDQHQRQQQPSLDKSMASLLQGNGKDLSHGQRYEQEHNAERQNPRQQHDPQHSHHHQHPPHQQSTLHASQPITQSSPYQNLNVQASQIASRSTPKLSFFPHTATQSNYTSESKETRSFNGLPGQLDPKPKPKTSKLKPIVLVEKTDDDHVESGAEDKCKANPGLFKRLVTQAKAKGSANEHAEVIERDLHRTFPENINFKSQITQQQDGGSQLSTENVAAIQSLRRVLLAFSLHCPSIGYCQSLNYIAGMLLLFMNEEQSFWTLSVIIQNFLPEGMYDVTMEGANIDQAVLMTLVMERLPAIWGKFSGGATSVEMDEGPGLPTVTLVTSHWFLTLFINILPVESILRVWDCFFYEGRKILFRVALTIMRLHEAEISKIDDPLEVFQVVQNIPKRLIDCHRLMEACFKRMGSFDLTTKDIDRRYDQFRTKRKNTRAVSQASRPTLRDVKK